MEFVRLISQQGLLAFHLIGTEKDLGDRPDLWQRTQLVQKLYDLEDIGKITERRRSIVIRKTPELTVRSLKSATYRTRGVLREPIITIAFRPADARRFARVTRSHIGRAMALLIDGHPRTIARIAKVIEGGRVEVRGLRLNEEAKRLAALLNLGALPYPVKISELGSNE